MFQIAPSTKKALLVALCLALLVVALGAITATAAPAPVDIAGTIDVPGNLRGALRYTGNPPPTYSSEYISGSPEIICRPETTPTTFEGTLNVATMSVGDVVLVGLLDKDLMATGVKGYQTGAYLYIYKNTATNMRVGPSDGNAGGELNQAFFNLTIPNDNVLDTSITIDGTANPATCGGGVNDDGCISITVEGQTRTDSYGVVGTSGVEFANGAYPGWDDYYNSGAVYDLTVNGCEATPPPQVNIQATDNLICTGSDSLTIDLSQVPYLYGYEFKVEYNTNLVTATGSFLNGWFDTSDPNVIKPWNATCNNGVCQFAASRQYPLAPISGGGAVAKIDFTRKAAGTFTAAIKDVTLSNIDGFAIPADVVTSSLNYDVCGMVTARGYVNLQGRTTPMNSGWIKLNDQGGIFPDINTTFDSSGFYQVANIPVMPAGSTYMLRATHDLYLGNQRSLTLLPTPATVAVPNTRLLGGDADNSGLHGLPLAAPPVLANVLGVDIADIGCMGTHFGTTGPGVCGSNPGNATDINNDGKTNIQDLSMTAGNYTRNPFQPW